LGGTGDEIYFRVQPLRQERSLRAEELEELIRRLDSRLTTKHGGVAGVVFLVVVVVAGDRAVVFCFLRAI